MKTSKPTNTTTSQGSKDPREDSCTPNPAAGLVAGPALDNHPQYVGQPEYFINHCSSILPLSQPCAPHIPMNISTDKLLTRKRVAEVFEVTKKTIARWTNIGKLTPIYINSRVVRYNPVQVNQLIKEATA